MGLFYFCIERTQRDRIDTNLGAQALLGHTNSPIEKCRSCTMLADRLPRYDLCAFLCVVCGRARVRISESVWDIVYPHTRRSVCCTLDGFGTTIKLTTSWSWTFAIFQSYVQSNGKSRGTKEKNRNPSSEEYATKT